MYNANIEITRIGLGGYNCYMLKNGGRFLLADTGVKGKHDKLIKAIEKEGPPEAIRLIVLTHGDHDHAGNCAYLKSRYGICTAMHEGDAEIVEKGNMTAGRKAKPDRISMLFMLMRRMSPPLPFDRFTPDVLLEDGGSLSAYGFDVKVAHTPGHSKGSITLVTPDGSAVCGDLFCNFTRPSMHMMIDDMEEAQNSLKKLRDLGVKTVYPGHGRPFMLEKLRL